jgi:aspartate/methionine/tyrosine aminotransferase
LPAPVFSSAAMLLALMIILGNSGDKVIVIDFDYLTTEKTVNGVTYSVYTHSDASTGANAELWVH